MIQKNSTSQVHHQERAVSGDDFEPLAQSTPGVGVARASVTSVHVNNEPWKQVVDLRQSAATDAVYKLDRHAGHLQFGDGQHGRRPPAGSTIRVHYRYGAGGDGIDISIQYAHGARRTADLWLQVSPNGATLNAQRAGLFACLRRWLRRR